jgi:hypothetical protein
MLNLKSRDVIRKIRQGLAENDRVRDHHFLDLALKLDEQKLMSHDVWVNHCRSSLYLYESKWWLIQTDFNDESLHCL